MLVYSLLELILFDQDHSH